MKGKHERRAARIAIVGSVITLFLLGCICSTTPAEPSPLDTLGVELLTPRDSEWSHVSGMSWSPDGSELALTWIRGKPNLRPEGYVYILDLEEREPCMLSQTAGAGEAAGPAWSPASDQTTFYSGVWDPPGVWLMDVHGEISPTFVGEGVYSAWSPDGQEIAIGDEVEGAIYIVDASTGERTDELTISGEDLYANISGISWSPDGERLAYSLWLSDHLSGTEDIHGMYVLDLLSGESRMLIEGIHRFPSWSPDGTMLAFSGEGQGVRRTLIVMRLEDGAVVNPLDADRVGPVAWSPDGSRIAFEWSGDVYMIDTSVALEEWLSDE